MSLPPGVDPYVVPLANNPSGAPPNFEDPPSLVPHFITSVVILTTLTTSAVISRAYVNLRAKRKIGWDDGIRPRAIYVCCNLIVYVVCCLFAWVTTTTYGGLLLNGT